MASIDYYVTDVKWYIRHHYSFYTILKKCGYIRTDILDPSDYSNIKHINKPISYANILSDSILKSYLIMANNTITEEFKKSFNNKQVNSSRNSSNDDHLRRKIKKKLLKNTDLIPSWNPIVVFLPMTNSVMINTKHYNIRQENTYHHNNVDNLFKSKVTKMRSPILFKK